MRITRRSFLGSATATAVLAAAPRIARAQPSFKDGRIDAEHLKAMQDALLEAGSVKKRLPLEEHYTSQFTPVRL